MATVTELADELRTLEERWDRITEVPPMPRTLMRVIEYSLGSQQKAEVYVNRLLRYLLDPTEPHGMGDDFLRTFLESLPEHCDFEEDIHDLSRIEVDDQVAVLHDDPRVSDESPGLVDLVLSAPNEWFVLVELKFYAGENNLRGEGLSQTEAYVAADHMGGISKDDYESGEYYVYLHPDDADGARACEFGNLTWQELSERVLEPLLMDDARRYPNRTTVQLWELVDDINGLTAMSNQQPDVSEKIELYLEHYDAIHDVTEAFEDRWDRFVDEWPRLLGESLEAANIPAGDWHIRSHTNDWGSIFRDGWWRRQSDHEPIDERDVGNDLRILFVHRLQHHRDAALGDNTLFFYLRNAGANDQAFIDAFDQHFYDRSDEIEQYLPENSGLTGQKRNLIEARYNIRTDEHDDFFAAYINALHRAFVDHAIENDPLVDIVDGVMEQALEAMEEP